MAVRPTSESPSDVKNQLPIRQPLASEPQKSADGIGAIGAPLGGLSPSTTLVEAPPDVPPAPPLALPPLPPLSFAAFPAADWS